MRASRPAYSGCPSLLILLICGEILTLAGCNSAPFQSAAHSSGVQPSIAKGQAPEKTIDESGWPGSARSGDADQKAQYHEVRDGETLPGVANMYGLSISRLLNANGLDNGEGLKPGQLLYIPRSP